MAAGQGLEMRRWLPRLREDFKSPTLGGRVCVCVDLCTCMYVCGQHCVELAWLSDRELVSRLVEIKRLSGQCVDPGDWVQCIGVSVSVLIGTQYLSI